MDNEAIHARFVDLQTNANRLPQGADLDEITETVAAEFGVSSRDVSGAVAGVDADMMGGG